MTPRLVLVEGFPGNGKSATAQWLARQLGRSGQRARWFYEEETPHPVLGDRPSRGFAAAPLLGEAREGAVEAPSRFSGGGPDPSG